MSVNLGFCFDRTFPASAVGEFSERLEDGGVDQLWVIEDCFYTAGISLAATALARTNKLTVGIGILPARARTAAISAMELATLAELAPGRLLAGIGHGVQEWMGQMGVRPRSPLTALDEVLTTVRRLLAGETVTFDGRYVNLQDVALQPPPTVVPPVLAGVRGPKSLALAGRVCDGLVLAEGSGPTYVRQALEAAGRPDKFRTSVFTVLCMTEDGDEARRIMAPFLAGLLANPEAAIRAHPHYDELQERFASGGEQALATIPAGWWLDIGAVGTKDDVLAHINALSEAGADDVALFPAPDLALAREDLETVIGLRKSIERSI